MKQLSFLFIAASLIVSVLSGSIIGRAASLPPCTVCIIELQTLGVNGNEDEDFVVITNRGTTNVTSLQLRYFNADGVLSETSSVSIGTLNAGVSKAFVSSVLSGSNPGADSLKTMALASRGGALVIGKTNSSAVFDTVGWGSIAKMYESSPVQAHVAGTTLARSFVGGTYVDSNDNAADFIASSSGCRGALFSEVQPNVTDIHGNTQAAWVELAGTRDDPGQCYLVNSSNEVYLVDEQALPKTNELSVLSAVSDADGSVRPLHLGETGGQLYLTGMSSNTLGIAVRTPLEHITFPAMDRGQTFSLIDGIWRQTYALTPGETNIWLPNRPSTDVPTSCTDIRITEVVPNPTGEDTDHEWLELHNESDQIVPLADCRIVLGDTEYGFMANDALAADEWRRINKFYTEDGQEQSFSLRNTDTNVISLIAKHGNESSVVVQSFAYADAPEGQSWARFDDGWRWLLTPTPSAANEIVDPGQIQLTEMPASQTGNSDGTNVSDSDNVAPDVGQATTIRITELLPNPAAPQTDEQDEYVELFNYGDKPVSLAGMKIQTGDTFSHSYALPQTMLNPGEYYTVTSGKTSITLSNASGRARLMSEAGDIISITDGYVNAQPGAVWALVNETWQWSGIATPGGTNLMAPVAVAAAKSQKSSVAKPKTTKAKAAKTAAAKTKKATKTTQKPTAAPTKSASTAAPIHIAVLVGVAALALLYAGYEYKSDIANRIYQFRRYREARRANRQAT